MFETVESPKPGTTFPETQVTLTTGIQSNTAYNITIVTNIYINRDTQQTISSDLSTTIAGYTGMLFYCLSLF